MLLRCLRTGNQGSIYFSWDHKLHGKQDHLFGENGVAEVSEDDNPPYYVTSGIHGGKKIMEIRDHPGKEKVILFERQRASRMYPRKEIRSLRPPSSPSTLEFVGSATSIGACPPALGNHGIDQGRRITHGAHAERGLRISVGTLILHLPRISFIRGNLFNRFSRTWLKKSPIPPGPHDRHRGVQRGASHRGHAGDKLSLDYPREKLEIIVVPMPRRDRTEHRQRVRGEGPPVRQEPRGGKTAALNMAIPEAAGDRRLLRRESCMRTTHCGT